LYDNLDRISLRTKHSGVTAVLHPHIGTVIETAAEVARVVQHSAAMLCLDTGHLLAAGADPVAITVSHPGRIGHVHLKDVDPALAAEVQAATRSFSDAVAPGLFCALGTGAVDVTAIVNVLESSGYNGWYVLEQDLKLDGPPAEPGPIADVRRSLTYIVDILRDLDSSKTALSAATR
jgi:inosose dehydratase